MLKRFYITVTMIDCISYWQESSVTRCSCACTLCSSVLMYMSNFGPTSRHELALAIRSPGILVPFLFIYLSGICVVSIIFLLTRLVRHLTKPRNKIRSIVLYRSHLLQLLFFRTIFTRKFSYTVTKIFRQSQPSIQRTSQYTSITITTQPAQNHGWDTFVVQPP